MSISPFFKNHLFYAVLVFLSAFAVLFLVIFPLHQRIRAEGDDIQKIVAKIENSERKIARLPEFESQHAVIRANENRIRLLVSEDRVVDFIREVETLAFKTGGEVTIAQGDATTAGKGKATPVVDKDGTNGSDSGKAKSLPEQLPWDKSLRLNLRFSGSYPEAANFLHKIETLPYRLDVLSLDFRPVAPEDARSARDADLFFAPPVTGEKDQSSSSSEPLVDASFEIAVYLE